MRASFCMQDKHVGHKCKKPNVLSAKPQVSKYRSATMEGSTQWCNFTRFRIDRLFLHSTLELLRGDNSTAGPTALIDHLKIVFASSICLATINYMQMHLLCMCVCCNPLRHDSEISTCRFFYIFYPPIVLLCQSTLSSHYRYSS